MGKIVVISDILYYFLIIIDLIPVSLNKNTISSAFAKCVQTFLKFPIRSVVNWDGHVKRE